MSDTERSADALAQRMLSKTRELASSGLEWRHAHGLAWLEERIGQWPAAWGDHLQVLVYGDFRAPEDDLSFPALGITVHHEEQENTVVRGALCVLKATVIVAEKSVPALIDAARRLNVLLGAYTLVEWGNSACGWWSWVTHDSGGCVLTKIDHVDIPKAIAGIEALPPRAGKKVEAALYWVREPKNTLAQFYRSDLLRVYSAYWNAFECLVGAVCNLCPPPKMTRTEKDEALSALLEQRGGRVDRAFVQDAFKLVVDPGFVAKATHALQVCFGQGAAVYVAECFTRPDRQERLYDIRNAINHGEVDAENPEELVRIDSRLTRLWAIVWGMFGRLVPFPAPLDASLQVAGKTRESY